jgi:DNA gyrase inhibitor GyrI
MDGTVMRWILMLSLAAGVAMAEPEPQSWRGYEVPAYSVERRDGPVEIRRTAPHLVAEVTLRGSRDATLRQGFRTLAGYIFGKNDGGGKVAMTAPVTQSPGAKIAMTAPVGQTGEGDLWTVRFAMPSKYTRQTLPQPTNPAIRIVEAPAERVAALRFSGWGSFGAWQRREAELRRWLAAEGLTASGSARHLYYDDPFTLPWRRRNEVVVPLR